ncbi:hypothetical protein ACHQM5_008379 [Ranunculus cassubicifolius]
MTSNLSPPAHFLLFPFMSKGHTIPLLHLTHLLHRRNISVTIITTPLNSSFISQSLTNTNTSIINIPFPQEIPEIPAGIESTDKLPSMSLFLPFAKATKLMQNDFEQILKSLNPITCVICDGFLHWAQESAYKHMIPVYFFYGMNIYSTVVGQILAQYRPQANCSSHDELFTLPVFPRIKLTKNDMEPPLDDFDENHPQMAFIMEQVVAATKTKGYIVNSFYELESEFVEYWNRECYPKVWCIGPLCLVEIPKGQSTQKPRWLQWLDERLVPGGRPVLYVAFGSQAKISREQYVEIANGLERSEVNFLWVIRSKEIVELDWFEERVKDRGLVVRDWVDQGEILSHEIVKGFMSHCGWNSVMESICECVPILAWPMLAEQHLNARIVVEELGVGIRVLAQNGSVRGFVGSECIESKVRELMEGDKVNELRNRVAEFGALAKKSMAEGGSSWCTLSHLIDEVGKVKV